MTAKAVELVAQEWIRCSVISRVDVMNAKIMRGRGERVSCLPRAHRIRHMLRGGALDSPRFPQQKTREEATYSCTSKLRQEKEGHTKNGLSPTQVDSTE